MISTPAWPSAMVAAEAQGRNEAGLISPRGRNIAACKQSKRLHATRRETQAFAIHETEISKAFGAP
eukprot:5117182-Alexandrium_andersonii.AAC.1